MLNRWRFVKNIIANLGRGSAAAIVALVLPPVLVRHMTAASYGVWVLVLQSAGYVGYFNFGLQTAIGRYVAYANEKNDVEQRDSVLSTALVGLFGAAFLSLACLAAADWAAPAIFPSIPTGLIPPMRLALAIVGFAMVVELPASACSGVFIGLERYEIPALTTGGARLLSAVGLVIAAMTGRSLVVMAVIIASANLSSYLAQYLVLRRVAPDIVFRKTLVRRSTAHELLGYCLGLTVMSFSMLLVTGFDLVFVGHFDFAAVTPYSVAASMITFIAGLLYAIINVLMPHVAMLHAREKAVEIGRLVISSTRLSMLVLIMTGIPLLIYAGPIMRVWIGQRYVESGRSLLAILIVANIIRLAGAPYSVILIAAGQQSFIKVSPLSEGISNLVASILMGALFGGIGVALGTLAGSLVGIGSHLWYSMPRTHPAINFSRRDFVISGILFPLAWTSPLWLAGAASFWRVIEIRPSVFAAVAVLSIIGSGWVVLRTGDLRESWSQR